MHLKLMIALFVFLSAVGLPGAAAQNTPATIDMVYLKDGSRMEGQIISYLQGEKVILRLANGQEKEIADDQIAKIVQGVAKDPKRAAYKSGPKPITKGVYNSTMLSFALGGGSTNAGLALGAGFANVTGYQFNRSLGLGFGLGLDNYTRRGETIYPLFLEARAFLPSKSNDGNYYLSASAGWGFAFKRSDLDITEANGGIMVYPAIGYRAYTSEGLDVNFDLGAKLQKASFVKIRSNGDVEERDILYRRLVLRVGLSLWGKPKK